MDAGQLAGDSAGGTPERRSHSTLSALRSFLPYVRPHWRGLLYAVIAVVSTSFVSLLRPWPIGVLTDRVLGVGRNGGAATGGTGEGGLPGGAFPVEILITIAAAIVGLAALQGLLSFCKDFFLSATGQRVALQLRSALFTHLQRLPLAFHDRQRTGDLLTRVTGDVTRVQELVTEDLLLGGSTNIIQLAGVLGIMAWQDWRLALVAVATAPFILWTVSHYRTRIKTEESQVREREGDLASLAAETISSMRTVKAFGRERHTTAQFDAQTGEMLHAGLTVTRLEARFSWMLGVVTACGLAVFVVVGAFRVAAGAITPGMLIVFITYMRDIQGPLADLSKLSSKIAKVRVRADRVLEVLDEHPAVADHPGARKAPALSGALRFDSVSYAYGPRPAGASGRPPGGLALDNINLTVAPGERIALVGHTGAGKTTLASLLLRLFDPLSGTVEVDGRDIRDYTLESYIAQVGVVLQESLLFRASVRENIAYGRPDASLSDIREAARVAFADEFIDRLPHGYDTMIGERGGTLSGGQRQRIAIARAVIRDPAILILDEPTAGLDAEAEATVMRALERLMAGRTAIVIAHHLHTVRSADRIVAMEHGRIVEVGTHDELLERGGAYARAYRSQSPAAAG